MRTKRDGLKKEGAASKNGRAEATKKVPTDNAGSAAENAAETALSNDGRQKRNVVGIVIETNVGDMELELYPDEAPLTVENFLGYVRSGFFDGLIFHRVIDGFMIQGGGFDKNMERRETGSPIKIESANGLKNDRGTVAMARTNDPDSATSQFFINLVDNDFLNYRAPAGQGWGYAVFGKVTKGMDVADKIASVPTADYGPFADVPRELVQIVRIREK